MSDEIVVDDDAGPDVDRDAVLEADLDVDREVRRLSRRGFITFGAAAAAGFGAYKWLRTRPRDGGLEWPLRGALVANESVAQAYYSAARLSPNFRAADVTRPRVNGHLGLVEHVDADAWRLQIAGAASPVALTLAAIRALPAHEMITELRCIEGWSTINRWKGARLRDVMERFPPPAAVKYLAMETANRGYYIGLDIESALHPQTLLVYEMNGAPLDWHHGAPLRLAIPIKYGIKNIKALATMRYTNIRPPDFWAERGYDWYAGH
ncbi:MAG TPA: molybdopterin-dependent oxidoreductase [Thermoanaerobaculia bacterium]|jgi:DMSO/TMAO reductase YedYZ molybdopterin-dependent catalytic subunit